MIQSHAELDVYRMAFEAAETQTWVRFAVECGYLSQEKGDEPLQIYDHTIGKLVAMIANPRPWLLLRRQR